jgi:hypothetical protein
MGNLGFGTLGSFVPLIRLGLGFTIVDGSFLNLADVRHQMGRVRLTLLESVQAMAVVSTTFQDLNRLQTFRQFRAKLLE